MVLLGAVVMPYLINIVTRGPVPRPLRWIESYTWVWIIGFALLLVTAAVVDRELGGSMGEGEKRWFQFGDSGAFPKFSLAGAAVQVGHALLWIFTSIVVALIYLSRSRSNRRNENDAARTELSNREESGATVSSEESGGTPFLQWPKEAHAGLLIIVIILFFVFFGGGDDREVPSPAEEAAFIDNFSSQSRASWQVRPDEAAKFNDGDLVLQSEGGSIVYAASTYMERIENPNSALSIEVYAKPHLFASHGLVRDHSSESWRHAA